MAPDLITASVDSGAFIFFQGAPIEEFKDALPGLARAGAFLVMFVVIALAAASLMMWALRKSGQL